MTLYFDLKGQYWVKLGERFVALGKDDVKLHALRNGIKDKPEANLTAVESLFWRAQTFRVVNYAGPLSGHRTGLLERTSGERLLVSDECNLFSRSIARGKPFPFIEGFIDALFEDGHEHVIGWLACSVRSLLRGDFAPGQMLALCGPPACGKSFFHYLATQLLGGRMAKPYPYLTGKTAFNGDLARAEHLVIEDEAASSDIRARRNFGSMLKQFTVAEEMHVHDKGKIAFTAPTFKRLTLSVNDEVQNLMILPPLDESIRDKVMLLRCKDAKGALHEDRQANKEAVHKELPAFTAFLKSYRIPKRIVCPRFGVQAFHNRQLVSAIGDTDDDRRVLDMVDHSLSGKYTAGEWRGTASQLEAILRQGAFHDVAGKVFYYPSACGVELAKLATKLPERFRCVTTNGRTEWRIKQDE